MQSNFNKSIENKTNKKECKISIDDILLQNRDIFNQLLIENRLKKEKSYISMTEYELLNKFENNLVTLIDKCNIEKLKDIFDEVNNKY